MPPAPDYWKLFKPAACQPALKAATKEAALDEIVATLVKAKALEPAQQAPALAALVERERVASTGIGMGVAIPHVQLRGIEQAVLSLAVHVDGLAWQALDGGPVHVIFTVLRPEKTGARHDPERHLELMRWISRLGRDGDFRRFARGVATRAELIDLLREHSGGTASG